MDWLPAGDGPGALLIPLDSPLIQLRERKFQAVHQERRVAA